MIIVAGSFRVPAGRVEEVRAAGRAVVEATLKEAGCIVYCFAFDVVDPTLLRIYEEWESQPQLDAHGKEPHMTPWRAKLAEVGISERKLTAYEAGAGRAL